MTRTIQTMKIAAAVVLAALGLAAAALASGTSTKSASSGCASEWSGEQDGVGTFMYPFTYSDDGQTLYATVYANSAGCAVSLTVAHPASGSGTVSATSTGGGPVVLTMPLSCPSSGSGSVRFGSSVVNATIRCAALPAPPAVTTTTPTVTTPTTTTNRTVTITTTTQAQTPSAPSETTSPAPTTTTTPAAPTLTVTTTTTITVSDEGTAAAINLIEQQIQELTARVAALETGQIIGEPKDEAPFTNPV